MLLHGSAPLGIGSGWDTSIPPVSLLPKQPQHQPLPTADPRATRRLCPPEPGHPLSDPGSSPWQHGPLPWAVTELDGPGDTAGTQLMGAWHTAGLGKSKSWKCEDPTDIREPSLRRTPQRRSCAPLRP